MNVSLTDDLGDFVAEQIREGGYNNQSEVVRESLRQMRERKAKLAYLRDVLAASVKKIDAGRSKPLTDQLLRETAARSRSRKTPGRRP